ncbi:MAG: oligopeptide/dipeptide ABC transporter ATP-binding protein [Chloroflexota bacterium]
MAEPILVAKGVSRSYPVHRSWLTRNDRTPARPALADVSLVVEAGETIGVVGESGSGKSTLARCISLLERPDQGRILFKGRDLTSLKGAELRAERRRIQIVFQDPFASLNPRISVGSALREVLTVHRLAAAGTEDARVAQLLEHVGLPARAAERYPAEFSGGQRQRVCIARALAAEPDVLIADEAVSALDVSIQAQILNLLLDLRDELGLTMIFITHNLHVVRRVAARVAVMFGGRIVELVPRGVPLEAALHPYSQALLAAAPTLGLGEVLVREGAPIELSGALPVVGCPFRDRCPLAFDACATIDPPLTAGAAGHLVACHDVARRAHAEGEP